MKKLLAYVTLKREAILLDSGLYIIKAFLAVVAAYYIAHHNPILKLDIISVLFGLMLTLEPVNLTGVRNGLSQVYATILGAACTAVIIYLLGINVFSIALSVAFTLYVCLKIDWRSVSPVAIFTSIYMTQYVQKNMFGEPSIFLTFRLRIYALAAGVFIAIIFNFIFSRFYYKSMINKRIAFIINSIIEILELTFEGISQNDKDKVNKARTLLPTCFNNIDWLFSLFQDLRREHRVKSKVFEVSRVDMDTLSNIIISLRTITHLNYDINYVLLDPSFRQEIADLDSERVSCEFQWILNELRRQNEIFQKGQFLEVRPEKVKFINDEALLSQEELYVRLIHDLIRIKNVICEIKNDIFKYSESLIK